MKPRVARRMFPPKSDKQTRKRGVRLEQLSIRVPKDLEEYVLAAIAAGYVKSHVVTRLMRVGKEAAEDLGAEWYEVEKISKIEGSTPGKVLAQLAKEALQRRKSGKKP